MYLLRNSRSTSYQLPGLKALRLCHRFGSGRFTDLPTELLDQIEGFVTGPVIDKYLEDWTKASRCFEGSCRIHDHVQRDDLIMLYRSHEEEIGLVLDSDENCEDLDIYDFDNMDFLTMAHHWLDRLKMFVGSRSTTPISRIGKTKSCISSPRGLFDKHFGLDIWFSFVTLNPQGTLAYLTPPAVVAQPAFTTSLMEAISVRTLVFLDANKRVGLNASNLRPTATERGVT